MCECERESVCKNEIHLVELKTLTQVTGDALRPDVKSVETSGQLKSLVTSVSKKQGRV
jgi:hypothetical protein